MTKPQHYEQLQYDERVAIAGFRDQGLSIRAMARILNRAASTVSREILRNTPSGRCSCIFAHKRRNVRSIHYRSAPKLVLASCLFAQVYDLLKRKWSLEQMEGIEGIGVRLQLKLMFKTARDLSRCFPVFQRQQAFLLRIKQNDFNYRSILGVTDVRIPVLRQLTHDLFFRHADLQNVIVLKVNAFHGWGSQWCMMVLTTNALSMTAPKQGKSEIN